MESDDQVDIGEAYSYRSSNKDGPGILYIFNHYEYAKNFPNKVPDPRAGTLSDVKRLQDTFAIFGIQNQTFHDLKYKEIEEKAIELSKTNFRQHSCIIITFLTHGYKNSMIAAYDQMYSYKEIIVKILRNPTLKSKTKIVIYEACRDGYRSVKIEKNEFQFHFEGNAVEDGMDSSNHQIYTDKLYELHSTSEALSAIRYDISGTIFIQVFCMLLETYGWNSSIDTIFELVMKAVEELSGDIQLPVISKNTTIPYVFGSYAIKPKSNKALPLVQQQVDGIHSFDSVDGGNPSVIDSNETEILRNNIQNDDENDKKDDEDENEDEDEDEDDEDEDENDEEEDEDDDSDNADENADDVAVHINTILESLNEIQFEDDSDEDDADEDDADEDDADEDDSDATASALQSGDTAHNQDENIFIKISLKKALQTYLKNELSSYKKKLSANVETDTKEILPVESASTGAIPKILLENTEKNIIDNWIPISEGVQIKNPVFAGRDLNGDLMFIGRTRYSTGEYMPCKSFLDKELAAYCVSGYEYITGDFEVLNGSGYSWSGEYCNGNVPVNAVAGGNWNDEPLYIGRAFHDKTLTPGKIHPSHNCLYIPFGGREYKLLHYEVLVRD